MIAADASTWVVFLNGDRGEDVDLLDRALEGWKSRKAGVRAWRYASFLERAETCGRCAADDIRLRGAE